MNPTTIPSTEGSENAIGDHAVAPLKVVIAYDDISAGRRAMSMLTRLIEQDIAAVELFRALWRFNFVKDPNWREQAIADALNADLLILSTSEPDAIPSAIESWVSAFLSVRRGTSVAILALFGCQNDWRIFIQEPASTSEDSQSAMASIWSDALQQLRCQTAKS